MKTLTMGSIRNIYDNCSAISIARHWVVDDILKDFCLDLKRFEIRLGDSREDEYWRAVLAPLKRYRFVCISAPIPFNHPIIEANNLLARISVCKKLYPDFSSHVDQVLKKVSLLMKSGRSPYLDFLTDFCKRENIVNTAVLIKDPRLIVNTQQILERDKRLQHIKVINPFQLREGICYENLIVFGSTYWYPKYFFTSPRSKQIHIVSFNWIRDNLKENEKFSAFPQGKEMENIAVTTVGMLKDNLEPHKVQGIDVLTEEDFKLIKDLNQISRRIKEKSEDNSEYQLEAPARLFYLEGEKGVFLENSPDASAIVIDLLEDEVSRVKRVAVQDILPDLFILLRTEGGGDYIVPIADKILGEESRKYRQIQRHWKELLLKKIMECGALEASIQLIDYGSQRANEVNIRNWVSPRSIKPKDSQDFSAIMKYIGLNSKMEEYWEIMEVIDRAHRMAGQHIRKLLLRQVLNANLAELV